jgi:uncharacterized membrane protein (UPF0182 family)
MAQPTPQSFANHARYVVGYHVVAFLLLLAYLVWAIVQLFLRHFSLASILGLVGAVVLAQLYWYARAFAVANQDRIIRLEMKLRMEKLLPADLAARFGEFTVGQLVALRFAGDAELPALSRKVLDEKIVDRKAIKLMIKDWQADHLRV